MDTLLERLLLLLVIVNLNSANLEIADAVGYYDTNDN